MWLFHLFLLWQNFKWEEQNYVVQNEINNLVFLVNGDKTSKVSGVFVNWLAMQPRVRGAASLHRLCGFISSSTRRGGWRGRAIAIPRTRRSLWLQWRDCFLWDSGLVFQMSRTLSCWGRAASHRSVGKRDQTCYCVCVGLIPTVLLFQFHSSHFRSCCLKRFYIFDVILVIKVLLFVLSFFCSLCLLHPWIFRPFC